MGDNQSGQLGDGTINSINHPEEIVAGVSNYNQILLQLLSGGNVRLSFVGTAGANYALERAFNLSLADWVALVTNRAGADGALVFTNMTVLNQNNFWRIRAAP